MKNRLIILTVFILTSCSTNWGNFFRKKSDTTVRNEKLIKSFKVEKEVLEKFEEKEQIAQKEVEKKTEPVEKKVPEDTPKRRVIKPDQKSYERLKPVAVVKKKTEYPEDYPPEFVEMDKKSKKVWSQYHKTVKVGEKLVLDMNYMGVSTGKIILTTKAITVVGNKRSYHFNARMKTSRYYSYLYELDDNIDSFMTIATNIPIKFSLIQRESGQDVDDLQLFDHEQLKTYTFYQRQTKEKLKKKKKTLPIPKFFQDPLSVIHFLRGLPFSLGAEYEVPVVNKGEVNTMQFKVLEKEAIKTAIGEKEAWKVRAISDYSGEKLKKGNMYFWFSADQDKIFLQFKAKITIGSISGEIESYDS